ncbi:hypothetical protein [Novosphingobium sp. B 225]|uniref:hypothetical protein n=1 Tax=Novosphingobium sp. B 225 TaxID=1961849 RepID=UPI0011251728|nr:hypothetical protein [Novosphingobium sp. B 225]
MAGMLSGPVLAQSANDYRLPGATGTPTSRAAGPVDPSDPTISQPRPRASATTASSPEPAVPSTAPSAAPTAQPRPAAVAPRAVRTAAPQATVPLPAQNAPAPQPSLTPNLAPAPQLSPSPSAAPVILPGPQAASAAGTEFDWRPWLVGALALLAGTGALLWWRRRRLSEPEIAFEPPVVPQPEPDPQPARQPAAVVEPEPATTPLPEPALSPAPTELVLTLEVRRLTASLMATTLSYSLRLTNNGAAPLAALAIEADMVSAHASLPVEQQIANPVQRMELRHAQVDLAPGESVEFTGDLRLSLADITPIRSGSSAYFVPLARFRVDGGVQVMAQTFVIGELPEQAGAALRPFRLDLGPRTYSRIGQRAVA